LHPAPAPGRHKPALHPEQLKSFHGTCPFPQVRKQLIFITCRHATGIPRIPPAVAAAIMAHDPAVSASEMQKLQITVQTAFRTPGRGV